jgi:hypothetical protein
VMLFTNLLFLLYSLAVEYPLFVLLSFSFFILPFLG